MRVYCCQFDIAWENKAVNHAKVRGMLDRAQVTRGSMVLLPEMFSCGFSMNVGTVRDDRTGEDQRFLRDTARELGVWIVGGIVTADEEGKGRNHAVVYSPAGERAALYTKLHPYSMGKEAQHYVAGRELVTFESGGFIVCPLICYDLRFPEAFRAGMRRGAMMFAVIANWPAPREEHWVTLLRARAIENQAYVVAVNRCGRDPWLSYFGRSLIVDPKGNVLADAGGEERVVSAEVDPAVVERWRAEFPVLKDARADLLGE